MVKRLLAILLTISLLSGMLVFQVSAETQSGTCGDNLTWTVDGSTLTISGTGPMYDYSEENPAPWSTVTTKLSTCIICEGVTSIGDYAFGSKSASKTVVAKSVQIIGSRAMIYGGKYYYLGDAPDIAADAYAGSSAWLYVVNWPESKKQSYGGNVSWFDADIRLDALASKQLVGLYEELNPEDIVFRLYFHFSNEYVYYTPREVSFSTYDNSTYGQKDIVVTADGRTFDFTYFVSDGTNHMDLIRVEIPEFPSNEGMWCEPEVYLGTLLLTRDDYYTRTGKAPQYGNYGETTITGKGIIAGYEETFYYPWVKSDLSNEVERVTSHTSVFTGQHKGANLILYGGKNWRNGEHYECLYENNINMGTATARIIGIGSCYGEVRTTFEIVSGDTTIFLKGNYLGTVDGELGGEVYVEEKIITPGPFLAYISPGEHYIAAYELYRIEEEQAILVDSVLTDVGDWAHNVYSYDFSFVYEDAKEKGGEIYLLSYSWATLDGGIYGGALILGVPAKVSEATDVKIDHIENDGDFRKEYVGLIGVDGTVGQATWSSSDPSVAEVEDGVITLKKPGTAIITGQYGQMSQNHTVTVMALDLTEGIIYDYSEQSGTARVIYNNRLLEQNLDYTLSARQTPEGVVVTVAGCGLFTGELEKTFAGLESIADRHTHSFDNSCDGVCNTCEYTRSNDHHFKTTWTKDQTHHWHSCSVCGEKAEEAEHVISQENPELCAICGPLCVPGDADGDGEVTDWDGVMMARYLAGWSVEVELAALDVDGDGEVTDWDGVILDRYLAGWSVTIG